MFFVPDEGLGSRVANLNNSKVRSVARENPDARAPVAIANVIEDIACGLH